MSDPEAACVAQHLDHDPATLTALTALTDPIDTESDAFDTAASIARDCAATITYLPTLITTINSQHGLTADQQTCLEKALTALDADQLTTLATGGTVDGSTLDQTVEDCGIG